MSLKHIRNKIKTAKRTSKVTRAMETVSAVKMRKSQERAFAGRAYAQAALRILHSVSRSTDGKKNTFVANTEGTHECIIVITSDKGLAGNLNSAVLKEATVHAEKCVAGTVEIISVGKKAYDHFYRRNYSIPMQYMHARDEISSENIKEIISHIADRFVSGQYRLVRIVYQNFISTFEQRAIARQIFPINESDVEDMIKDIIPRHGKYSEVYNHPKATAYTLEESSEELYDRLFKTLAEIMLYHALLESKASEHSARMVAMKNATEKADEISKKLALIFNKKRQTVITSEVCEITAGIEVMKNIH